MGDSIKAAIAIISAVTLIIVGGYYVWDTTNRVEEVPTIVEVSQEAADESLGEDLFNGVETAEGTLPETNPLDKDTNPFGDIAVNPFEGLNPFE